MTLQYIVISYFHVVSIKLDSLVVFSFRRRVLELTDLKELSDSEQAELIALRGRVVQVSPRTRGTGGFFLLEFGTQPSQSISDDPYRPGIARNCL